MATRPVPDRTVLVKMEERVASSSRLRQKWLGVRRNTLEGEIVLVKDIDLPRNQWPLGRIVRANPDDDGLVRRVKVKTQSSVLERSVHKLVLLVEM